MDNPKPSGWGGNGLRGAGQGKPIRRQGGSASSRHRTRRRLRVRRRRRAVDNETGRPTAGLAGCQVCGSRRALAGRTNRPSPLVRGSCCLRSRKLNPRGKNSPASAGQPQPPPGHPVSADWSAGRRGGSAIHHRSSVHRRRRTVLAPPAPANRAQAFRHRRVTARHGHCHGPRVGRCPPSTGATASCRSITWWAATTVTRTRPAAATTRRCGRRPARRERLLVDDPPGVREKHSHGPRAHRCLRPTGVQDIHRIARPPGHALYMKGASPRSGRGSRRPAPRGLDPHPVLDSSSS